MSLAQRKLMSQQKSRRTKEVQEEKEATEEAMGKLTPLRSEPPQWLDSEAEKEWDRILPLMSELPVADLDMALLAMYCQTYSNYKLATEKLKDNMVIETERGTKLSSYYTVQRDSVSTMNSIAPKLGLTVESRLKILAPSKDNKEKSDPFEDLMNEE